MAALPSTCRHYIFALWFILYSVFPRLISAVADRMFATCTHVETLLPRPNAGLKSDARGTRKNSGRKKSPSGRHRTTLPCYLFATKAYRQPEKSLLSSNISYTCPDNMVNFGSPAAEICWRVWGIRANFNGFRVLAALLHGTLVLDVELNCGIEQTVPPIFARAAITLFIGPHF